MRRIRNKHVDKATNVVSKNYGKILESKNSRDYKRYIAQQHATQDGELAEQTSGKVV